MTLASVIIVLCILTFVCPPYIVIAIMLGIAGIAVTIMLGVAFFLLPFQTSVYILSFIPFALLSIFAARIFHSSHPPPPDRWGILFRLSDHMHHLLYDQGSEKVWWEAVFCFSIGVPSLWLSVSLVSLSLPYSSLTVIVVFVGMMVCFGIWGFLQTFFFDLTRSFDEKTWILSDGMLVLASWMVLITRAAGFAIFFVRITW